MQSADLMLAGVFSFENADKNIVNILPHDVLGSVGRLSLVRIRRALVGFRPTRVMVQCAKSRAEDLHAMYRTYLMGSLEGLLANGDDALVRSETYQLAFRVADLLYLPRLICVDSDKSDLFAPDEPLKTIALDTSSFDTLYDQMLAMNSLEYHNACSAAWRTEAIAQEEMERNEEICANIIEALRQERTLVFLSAQRCAPVMKILRSKGVEAVSAYQCLKASQE